jgi:hypothetical protein
MPKMERTHFYVTCGEIDLSNRIHLLTEYFNTFPLEENTYYSVISNKDIHKYLDAVNNPDTPMSSRQLISDSVLNKYNIEHIIKKHYNTFNKTSTPTNCSYEEKSNAIKMCLSKDKETSILGKRLCARHYLHYNLCGTINDLVAYNIFLKSLFYNISIKYEDSLESKVVKEFCAAPYDFLKLQIENIDKKYFNLYLELAKS